MSGDKGYVEGTAREAMEPRSTTVKGRVVQWGGRQYPVRMLVRAVVMTALMALALIAQRNQRHALWLREQALQKELGDLRSESVVVGAELMQMGQECEVKARIAEQGIPLRSPRRPAMVLKEAR